MFVMGKWNNYRRVWGEKPSDMERKESRKPGNVEVQIMEEHVLRALLPIQKEEDDEILKLSL